MANFCSNCRFPLAASASFCQNCGTQQAPAQAPAAAAAATGGGSSAVKIIVIVVACFAVLGVAALAAGYYAVYKVKQAAVAKAGTYGVDLNAITSPVGSSSASRSKVYKPCELLPQSEVSSLLGQPIERSGTQDSACLYFGPAGLAEKLAAQGTADMMNKAKAGEKMNGGDVADTVTRMLGAAAAKSGANGVPGGEAPLLTFLVEGDGQAQMTALTATKGIFSGIGQNSGAGGLGADIPNLGERAILLGPLGLNVLKNGVILRIIVGPVPGANDKAVAVARAVLPRI